MPPLTKSRKRFLRRYNLMVSKKCISPGLLIKNRKKLQNWQKHKHVTLGKVVSVWLIVHLYNFIQRLNIIVIYSFIKKVTI